MKRAHLLAGLAGGLGLMALAGLVAAQEANKTAPASPAAAANKAAPAVSPSPAATPAAPPVVTTTVPNTPAAKALANAVTPEEGPPPPKTEAKPVVKAEAPPPAPAKPAEPLKRARYTAAVMQAVDKITAETLRFETKVGEPVRFKGLILTVRSCETSAADEPDNDNIAYLDVQSQPISTPGHAAAPPRQVFRGWMFANSPGLHPFEHPIYDVWLIACKTTAPVVPPPAAPKAPATPAKAPAKRT